VRRNAWVGLPWSRELDVEDVEGVGGWWWGGES